MTNKALYLILALLGAWDCHCATGKLSQVGQKGTGVGVGNRAGGRRAGPAETWVSVSLVFCFVLFCS